MTAVEGPRLHVLRGGGTALVLLERADGLPEILHWGAELSEADAHAAVVAGGQPVPHSAFDEPWPLTLLPGEPDGWSGRPGLQAHRDGRAVQPRWRDVVVQPGPGAGAEGLTVSATDPDAGVSLLTDLTLDAHGVLAVRHTLTSTVAGQLEVGGLLAVVPLPVEAVETLDLTGRWCRERSPVRLPLVQGGRVRESRRGRTGHDATLLLVAGTAGFGFAAGEVHAVHLGWSGDHVHLVDRLPEGAGRHGGVLAAGELLRPGEVRLGEGESYDTPVARFAWAEDGLDGLTARWHGHVRDRAAHPRTPRPVTLNSWEAVYFDHDHDRLGALVDTAARLGVERVVLDDGWFRHRRHDRAGLGDWYVDEDVWPTGLGPFTERVRGHGMQVGIWVEPEMVNVDSDLVRAHPDWLLAPPGGAREWRHQQLLDLTRPEAFAYVLERLDDLVRTARPHYLKWDHNRDLHEAVDGQGRAAVRRQTLATYRLLAELGARHPDLEIESCSSGGARVDLGVLEHTHRVWASDCNDPLERQVIQRWTGLLLPPELVGTHVGPDRAHTTMRVTDLELRCLTALFGHAGIEWDVSVLESDELDRLAGWVALHKRLRPLLHSGRTVRGEERDGAWWHGVVAGDRSRAVYAYVRLASGADAVPGRVRLTGLDDDATYRVRAVDVTGGEVPLPAAASITGPAWVAGDGSGTDGLLATGRLLSRHGLAMPVLGPGSGVLVEVTAEQAAVS